MSEEISTVTESVEVSLRAATSGHKQLVPYDVQVFLVAALRNDPILKPVLRSTPTDPRVYHYYQPAAEIDSVKRAYITYAMTALPEATQAVTEPVFTLAIWAFNQEAIHTVRERLVALLNERPLTLSSGEEFWGTKVSERDSYQENTKFAGKQLVFRFGFSKV